MKRWIYPEFSKPDSKELQSHLKIHPVLCDLLVQRGINTYDEAFRFFRPQLTDLLDPFLMKDMEKAVGRILAAHELGQKIMLFGDYDVDGTTSVAILYKYLKPFFHDIIYYIPHRHREGYGLSKEGIDLAIREGCQLIITLDCGIKAVQLVRYASGKGLHIIVGDHHIPGCELPPALAILNPKQKDCGYPYKELSGCGIAFKLIQALEERTKWDPFDIYSLLDLVVVSIASDIVPIIGENRILAHYGMKVLNDNPSPGILALMNKAGIERVNSISDIVFILGPRINAVGRMDDANEAVKLLVSESIEDCNNDAVWVNIKNEERKKLDREITLKALEQIKKDQDFDLKKATIVYDQGWHKGVVGIVASRLIEHHHKPTIVLTFSNGLITGSARSVKGFNITEALTECKDLLYSYGGHEYAAGLSLEESNLMEFVKRFLQICDLKLKEDMLIPNVYVDAVLDFHTIDAKFFNILRQFAPFGPSNRRPVFVSCNVNAMESTRIVKEEHLKLSLVQHQRSKKAIAFNMAKYYPHVINRPFDICYSLEENTWKGYRNIELVLKDIKI